MTPKDEKITEEHRATVDEQEAVADHRGEKDDASTECRDVIDRLQRLQAEFENYKKRTMREMQQLDERISDRELLSILPLYDNLQRAFASYAADGDKASLIAGVEQIFAQFSQILDDKSVERISALGSPFDPALHEALLGVASDQEKNTILEEFSPGYTRNGRTLRPSKVAVSQGPASIEEEDE